VRAGLFAVLKENIEQNGLLDVFRRGEKLSLLLTFVSAIVQLLL